LPSNKKLKCKNNKIRNKEDSMKKQFLIALTAITCLFSACSTSNFAYYDDIYSSTDEKEVKTANPAPAQMATQQGTVEADSIIYETDENGNLLRTLTYYPGSSEPVITTYMEVADGVASAPAGASSYAYDPDDYYDYSYSSRIRRFHTDVYTGWGYYDPYFTNMYWYDYCPASWGISIYMGYNWWWPSYYYRPYYYDPFWYDYGFRYGWGWYGPRYHYAYCDPWHHPYHHHGPEPIDYYHNHHDHNNSYYYGHRSNIGPSVGNGSGHGERPSKDDPNRPLANGYGNGETNNYYSSPASFNQRYDAMANGATGVGSAPSSTFNSARTETPTQPTATGRRDEISSAKPATSNVTTRPATSTTTNGSTITRPTTPTTATATNTPNTTSSKPSGTVTRTVVTPSNGTTRPANATTPSRTVTTTRPATTTTRPASTSGSYNNTGTGNPTTTRPTTTRPTTTRPATASPSSNSRPEHSSSSNQGRPSQSSSTTNSRSYNRPSSSSSSSRSYSTPSSSHSSYSSSSSRSSGSSHSSGHSGGGHSGGGHATGRR
jgi:hypothetical protein